MRVWHSLLLGKWNELFYWLLIEELIRDTQQEYDDALGQSDRETDCTVFVEFMLRIILNTLQAVSAVGNPDKPRVSSNPYIQSLSMHWGQRNF